MSSFISVDEARSRPGLRLVLTIGVPGPWGEAAKGIFHAKGVAFARVPQLGAQPNPELLDWTGIDNAPQVVLDDERPLSGWVEILLRAEKLAPAPRLLPEDAADRALMFGLSHELMGQGGFCWTRRLMMVYPLLQLPEDNPARTFGARLADKYGIGDGAEAEAAPERMAAILRMLSGQLARQREAGSAYLVGDALSAADIYWAASCALVSPLPADVCPMSDMMRASYGAPHPLIDAALDPALVEHRDRIYRDYMELPIVLE